MLRTTCTKDYSYSLLQLHCAYTVACVWGRMCYNCVPKNVNPEKTSPCGAECEGAARDSAGVEIRSIRRDSCLRWYFHKYVQRFYHLINTWKHSNSCCSIIMVCISLLKDWGEFKLQQGWFDSVEQFF